MRSKLILLLSVLSFSSFADWVLIPMSEEGQRDHLKSYGIAYWSLARGSEVQWLLNYEGGSFMIPSFEGLTRECTIRGVTFETITDGEADGLLAQIASPSVNMEAVKLEKAPKIAVYSPEGNQPWDDAVTLVLTYAEIPYDIIYDEEVLNDELTKYDWLHLHHEDFTGQYGKFYSSFRTAAWYIEQKLEMESEARRLGFDKVSELKLAVALRIKEYVAGGGFLFAMCSATDSYDIALSAEGVDICEPMFDGDPSDPGYQGRIDFSRTLAFEDFRLSQNPNEYEFSNIDMTNRRRIDAENDFFTLFEYSAKWDVIPSMLCQNHTRVIAGFMGQTTAYDKDLIKPDVLIMGQNRADNEARYIHGELGRGQWTFYGGHDPEDYTHRVGDPPTELELHPNSPGYRLILNNILFPAARKQKQKT
ncbi:asparagine synthetase B [Phaeocystidibacter luteus]|uniref:Asparagine synthetase B n=1 Tax=Phaeocystidibacter luteus TaxID=911197 RepID=A0A6N6RDA0_9FLAO|nr:asparagine synthetase B [Phaeocystidibacter luteus]KAB2806835.1 asparagine synthetase B [Phaeocystidibacter luteus]